MKKTEKQFTTIKQQITNLFFILYSFFGFFQSRTTKKEKPFTMVPPDCCSAAGAVVKGLPDTALNNNFQPASAGFFLRDDDLFVDPVLQFRDMGDDSHQTVAL